MDTIKLINFTYNFISQIKLIKYYELGREIKINLF